MKHRRKPDAAAAESAAAARRYGLILVDPPWHFRTWTTHNSKGPDYRVMGREQICRLPVADLAAADCMLVLWATQAQLHHALEAMQCWGFTFKSVGAWAKQSRAGKSWAFGTGYILRSAAEFFLIGTRGNPKSAVRNQRNLIVAPVREHSRKPDEMYDMLEAMFPDARKCELFARTRRRGWDSWGDGIEPTAEELAAASRRARPSLEYRTEFAALLARRRQQKLERSQGAALPADRDER